MTISFSGLMAGFVFGVWGLWLIRQAKVKGNIALGLIGLTMMVYTYFTTSPWGDWGVGIVLGFLAYRLFE